MAQHPTPAPISPDRRDFVVLAGELPRDAAEATETKSQAVAEEVRQHSPEGEPGDPKVGGKRTGLLIALFAAVILVAGVVLAITIHPAIGFGVALVMPLALAANPEVWAGILRGKERDQAKRVVEGRVGHTG